MRKSGIEICYFEDWGSSALTSPPALSLDQGLQQYDLYIHRNPSRKHQIWRCESCHPLIWVSLLEGLPYTVPGCKDKRIFVMTDTGLPSFVTPDTVDRLYKHLKNMPPGPHVPGPKPDLQKILQRDRLPPTSNRPPAPAGRQHQVRRKDKKVVMNLPDEESLNG